MDEAGRLENPQRGLAGAVVVGALGVLVVLLAGVLGDRELMQSTIGRATPLLIAVGLVFGALAVRYSSAGLPLLVALVYLNLSQALVRYHDFPSLLQILVVGLVFAAWLKRDTDDPAAVARQPVTLLLALYLLLLLVTTAVAADRELADDRLVEMGKAFVIFALTTLLMRNRERMMQAIVAMVAAASFLGVLVLIQMVTGDFSNEFAGLARIKQAHIYGRVFQPRIAGPLGDPNFFAQILLLALPFAVLFGVRSSKRMERAWWLTGAALALIASLLTYSRGAMVALAVMALMLVKALHISWKTTFAVLALALVLLGVMPESVSERFLTIEQILPSEDEPLRPDSSFEERKLFMRVAWVMFGANPVLGVGAANYTVRYDDYVGLTASTARQYEDQSDLHYPHNLYLEVAAESGLLGLVLFIAIIIAVWTAARTAEAAVSDPSLRTAATAVRIALVGYLVSAMFLHLAFPRYLFLLFAFPATLQRLSRRHASRTGTEAS